MNTARLESILADPKNHVQGLQIGYTWRELEPQKNMYNFSKIERFLDTARKYNKHIFVQVMERTWKNNDLPVPDYLYDDPAYNGGVFKLPSKKGFSVARIWDPSVIGRLNLLITAMGKRFDNDPNFEGIIFCESSLGIKKKDKVSGYSPKALLDGMISRITNAKEAFPNSVVIQYMNYGPSEFEAFFEFLRKSGAGMGGPDLVPDKGRHEKKERIPAYKYYREYAGKMPLGIAVQSPNLVIDSKNKKGIFSLDDFWDMGINTLEVNYIFWAFVQGPHYKFNFTEDILPYINKKGGYINAKPADNHRN